jgi:hypothetical protein
VDRVAYDEIQFLEWEAPPGRTATLERSND